MKSPLKRTLVALVLVAVCVLLATVVIMLQDTDDAGWFVVNYRAYKHALHISINGQPHIVIEQAGSGLDSKPSPLREGTNQVVLRFEPRREDKTEIGPGSRARILLSPTMMVGTKPLPGVEFSDVDNYCECEVEIVIARDLPKSFKYTRREWISEKKQALLFQEHCEKQAFSNVWDKEEYKTWTENGALLREERYAQGKLDRATSYRPDGTVGAEVKEGNGFLREWYEDGSIAMEVPVVNGAQNGLMKMYSDDGEVVTSREFKDGQETAIDKE